MLTYTDDLRKKEPFDPSTTDTRTTGCDMWIKSALRWSVWWTIIARTSSSVMGSPGFPVSSTASEVPGSSISAISTAGSNSFFLTAENFCDLKDIKIQVFIRARHQESGAKSVLFLVSQSDTGAGIFFRVRNRSREDGIDMKIMLSREPNFKRSSTTFKKRYAQK